jgi:iron complex outermembrane receptor protein
MYLRAEGLMVSCVALTAALAAPSAVAQVAGAGVSSAGQVTAPQAPAETQAEPSTDGIGDIIVTAQRRSESLQKVPVAVTALGSDYLQSRSITSIAQIASAAPNVKIERAPSSKTTSQVSIRGSASSNPAITTEPAVGIYLDGVYIAKAAGSIFDVVDLERVEVLRGPQGTLYGRNTLAGAINLVPRRPSGEFGGRIEASYGTYNERRLRGYVDLPEVGFLSAKVSGQIQKRDGLIRLVPNPYPQAILAGPNPSDRVNDIDNVSLAAQLRAKPSDTLTIDYMFDWSRTEQTPDFAQLYRINRTGSPADIFDPNSPSYPFAGQFFPLNLYTNTERQSTASIDANPTREKVLVQGHALTASLDLGGATLKSITAYRKLSYRDALDLDGTPLPVAYTQRITDYHAFSQELQLTGDLFSEAVKYVAGLYYFKDKAETDNPQRYFGGGSRFQSRFGQHTEAYAAYVQADIALADQLTLTAGLRYTEENKDIMRFLATASSATGPFTTAISLPYGGVPNAEFKKLTPAVSLRYQAADNVSLYARFAQGYKSGGFNAETAVVVAPTPACPTGYSEFCQPYRPEQVDSYEAGIKTRVLDDKLQFNLTGFWNEHTDLQLSVFLGTGSAASIIRNAASARTAGIEVEVVARPAPSLTYNVSFGLLDAKYKSFIDGGIEVADNRAFPSAPRYTIQTGMDWRVAQGDWGRFNLIGDLSFVSAYHTSAYALRGSPQVAGTTESPGRTIVNLRGTFSEFSLGSAVKAELSLWVRNLTEERAPQNFIDFGPSFGGLTVAYYPDPRTAGVTLGVTF